MRRLTSTEIRELRRCKEQVLTGREATAALVRSARRDTNAAVAEAVLVGLALRRIKKLGGDDWLAMFGGRLNANESNLFLRIASRRGRNAFAELEQHEG